MTMFLEAVEARAGAAYEDRLAWLAKRRTGITATEVRDLYLKKVTQRELIDRKLGRTPEVGDLNHVPVIRWGNEREPVIAAVAAMQYGLRAESRVFQAADEPRFLASPDLLGVYGFDEEVTVGEIKTAGEDIRPGSPGYERKGYELQQQWAMRVIGASRSLYAWEIREDAVAMMGQFGEFTPGPLRFEWVYRNDALIASLEKVARRFLKALDKAAAEAPPVSEPVDEELDTHAVNYLRALELERQAKALKAPAWAAMLAAGKSQVSALARITYRVPDPVEVEEVDYEAARAAAPEKFEALQKAQAEWESVCAVHTTTRMETGRPTLRVTPVKTKDQGNGFEDI